LSYTEHAAFLKLRRGTHGSGSRGSGQSRSWAARTRTTQTVVVPNHRCAWKQQAGKFLAGISSLKQTLVAAYAFSTAVTLGGSAAKQAAC
jgi:hypothetical protein